MTLYTNPIATRLFNNNVFIVAWVLDTYFIEKNVITPTLEDDFKYVYCVRLFLRTS